MSIGTAHTNRLKRTTHVVSTVNGSDTVVHNLRDGQTRILNEVGGRVWAMLDEQGVTLEAIIDVLAREYALPSDAPHDQIQRDVVALLTQLHDAGLISIVA
jgi:hypothetical protein